MYRVALLKMPQFDLPGVAELDLYIYRALGEAQTEYQNLTEPEEQEHFPRLLMCRLRLSKISHLMLNKPLTFVVSFCLFSDDQQIFRWYTCLCTNGTAAVCGSTLREDMRLKECAKENKAGWVQWQCSRKFVVPHMSSACEPQGSNMSLQPLH